MKFTRSARGPLRQEASAVQRAAILRPLPVTLRTTGPRSPSATRIALSPPKLARAGGDGEPAGAGPASLAVKRRVGLRLQAVRRPFTVRVPVIRRVPEAIVPSAWPASVHANAIRPPPIRRRRAAPALKLRPSNGTTARPTVS